MIGPRSRSTSCTASNSSTSVRVQSSRTSATSTWSAMPKVRSSVGEAVAAIEGERAHGGSGDDALVLLRQRTHALAECIPLLDGEHGHDASSASTALEASRTLSGASGLPRVMRHSLLRRGLRVVAVATLMVCGGSRPAASRPPTSRRSAARRRPAGTRPGRRAGRPRARATSSSGRRLALVEAEVGGVAQQAGDPGVGVLHVEHRVVVAAPWPSRSRSRSMRGVGASSGPARSGRRRRRSPRPGRRW